MLSNKAEVEITTRRGWPINSYFVGFTLLFATILELVHFTSAVFGSTCVVFFLHLVL